jgi:glutamate 5-kinase
MRRAKPPGLPVVVKIGSSSLTNDDGSLDGEAVERVAAQIADVRSAGHPAVLVSSGAVAAGLQELGMDHRPADLPGFQAAAAVGQGKLMERYSRTFATHGIVVGQVLLTRDVLARRDPYLHARAALERMLELGLVPIVNENDSVAVEELKLGDNDRLAAIVSHLVQAGLLVILTDTAGLYAQDPRLVEGAELLSAVRHSDEVLDGLRSRTSAGDFGSGGVATKVAAARMTAFSGIPTVVAGADDPEAVRKAVAGEEVGTWVDPGAGRLSARKLWIAFGLPASGRVVIDDGAMRAVAVGGKSLLAVGITEVAGDFGRGDAVEVFSVGGDLVAKGLANLDSDSMRAAIGRHTSMIGGAAIHRDDLVVLV